MPWKMDWDHWWLVWIARFLWGHTGFGLNLHPNLACQVRLLPFPLDLEWFVRQGPQVHRAPHFRFRESSNNMLFWLMYHNIDILQHMSIITYLFVVKGFDIVTTIILYPYCTVVRILTKAMFLISIIPLILAVLLILGSAAAALSKGWEARHHNPRLHSFLLDIRNVSINRSLTVLIAGISSVNYVETKQISRPKLSSGDC